MPTKIQLEEQIRELEQKLTFKTSEHEVAREALHEALREGYDLKDAITDIFGNSHTGIRVIATIEFQREVVPTEDEVSQWLTEAWEFEPPCRVERDSLLIKRIAIAKVT